MNTRLIIGALIVLIGISILLDLNLFHFLLPLLLIWIGIQIILGKDGVDNSYKKTETQEDSVRRVLIFSGINQTIISDNFKGGEVITVFGTGEIDLTKVKTKEDDIRIELVTVIGKIHILVPTNWAVSSEGVGVLGTFDNKANGSKSKKSVHVTVKGVSVLGNVVISN